MEISQLEAFVAVAKSSSFSKASDSLHLSQPAISRRIALLEHSLKSNLFERTPSGILLSDAGKLFLPYAMRVMSSIHDGREALRTNEEAETGTINIALVGTLANTELSQKLKIFKQQHPKVVVKLQTALSHEVSELVAAGEAHIGLRYFSEPGNEITSHPLSQEQMITVCSADSKLLDTDRFQLEMLQKYKFLCFAKSRKKTKNSFYQLTQKLLIRADLDQIELMPVDSLSAQKRLTEADFGVALLPLSSVEEEIKLGSLRILEHPLLETLIDINLIHRKSLHMNSVLESFIEALK